jgi:predicted Na+-dependent transporter
MRNALLGIALACWFGAVVLCVLARQWPLIICLFAAAWLAEAVSEL